MRLIGVSEPTEVRANISAEAYRKLCSALRPLSHEELWKVLDHYLVHCLTDRDVEELVKGLGEMKQSGVPLTASAALSLVEYEKAPTDHDRPALSYLVSSVPTAEAIEESKDFLDLIFDETYFESYTPPELRAKTARALLEFTKNRHLPDMPHWHTYLADEDQNPSEEA